MLIKTLIRKGFEAALNNLRGVVAAEQWSGKYPMPVMAWRGVFHGMTVQRRTRKTLLSSLTGQVINVNKVEK